MTRAFSTYLDAVRLLAALTVVFCHFTFEQFTGGIVRYQGTLAGEAVNTFFVLSGYVIAYISCEKERTLASFAIHRCARIYSVAVPALVLTIAIDAFLATRGVDDARPVYEYDALWKYLPLFLVFATEIWTFHIKVLTDGAFWSLSYEVWYYVTFAVAFYLVGWRRALLLPLCLIALGLPALILFPIWLLGAAVYYLHQRTSLPKPWARAIALLSIVALVAMRSTAVDATVDDGVNAFFGGWPAANLHYSSAFPSAYVTASLIALNLYAMRYCDFQVLTVRSLRNAIAYAASFTFAIYLGHLPLMNFWSAVIRYDPHSLVSVAVLVTLVLVSVYLFGFISEHCKTEWRTLFRRLFQLLGANVARESRV